MATHSSVLAWRIPGTREPGGLPSMGSHRVRHNWSDLAAAARWAKWAKGYFWTWETPTFPHISLLLKPLSPNLLSFPAFLCLPMGPHCVISCHLAPAPISLLICSYLPAVTNLHQKLISSKLIPQRQVLYDMFHLCEIPRVVTFVKAESRMVVAKGWGGGA